MSKNGQEKIYQMVTDRILAALDAGTVPWRKPWHTSRAMSLATGEPYQGINQLVLSSANHKTPFWLTYKEAQRRGGHVRQGEKGCPVIFWKWVDRKDQEDVPAGEREQVGFMKYHVVFNYDQCEGVFAPEVIEHFQKQIDRRERGFNPIEQAEVIVAGMPSPPAMIPGGNRAFYRPRSDELGMPERLTFESEAGYYCTLFHELAHSTGHKSRLGRAEVVNTTLFGSHDYGVEELVAEITAAMLCAVAEIEDDRVIENQAAYVDNWRQAVKDSPRMIVTAAQRAQKAAGYILNEEGAETGQENEDEPVLAESLGVRASTL